MKIVTSISGGKTSAYLAANYESDALVFSLVRTSDKMCQYKDRTLAKRVEERINKPFVGTLEDDVIIKTIFDLEQYLGKEIDWVSGITFDQVVQKGGGWLPNKLHRYCSSMLKIEPIFYWWAEKFKCEPVIMNIGYRANERNRVVKTKSKLNQNGLLEFKATFGKWMEGKHKGKNKWEMVEWQAPRYPLVIDQIFKDDIERYWDGKPVVFADENNCVGCFHRNSQKLKKQSKKHPEKFDWFARQEGGKNGYWRSDVSYKKIKTHFLQSEIPFPSSNCESGFCGV